MQLQMETITLEKRLRTIDKILTPDQILDLFKKTKISKGWSFEGFKPSQTSKLM